MSLGFITLLVPLRGSGLFPHLLPPSLKPGTGHLGISREATVFVSSESMLVPVQRALQMSRQIRCVCSSDDLQKFGVCSLLETELGMPSMAASGYSYPLRSFREVD